MKYWSINSISSDVENLRENLQKEPIILSREEEELAVMLSIEEYQKITEANVRDFQKFCDQVGQKAEEKGLTKEKLKEILEDE